MILHSNEKDERLLYLKKENFCGYKHCPVCSSELEQKTLDSVDRLVCTNAKCDFVYYHNPAPAAGAIIIKDNQLLLVKRAHFPRKNFWCLPAGFMEWQEHPSQTAKREVEEETGLKIELTSLFNIYSGVDDPRTNAILILYLAKEVGGKMDASDDAIDVAYFVLDEIPDDIAFEAHRQAIADYSKSVLSEKL